MNGIVRERALNLVQEWKSTSRVLRDGQGLHRGKDPSLAKSPLVCYHLAHHLKNTCRRTYIKGEMRHKNTGTGIRTKLKYALQIVLDLQPFFF